MRAAALIISTCFLLCNAAVAREPSVRSIWIVQPTEVSSTEQSVAPDGIIFTQRLLPAGLAHLDAEFSNQSALIALPAGAELLQIFGAPEVVFCATTTKPDQAFTPIRGPRPDLYQCFIDAEADGSFDQAFSAPKALGLPGISGRLPKKRLAISPLSYSTVAADTFSGNLIVGLKYKGQAKIGTLRRFTRVFNRADTPAELFTDNIFTKRDSDLPKTLNVMGSKVAILGGKGDNVSVRVDAPMPPQPFSLVYEVTTIVTGY